MLDGRSESAYIRRSTRNAPIALVSDRGNGSNLSPRSRNHRYCRLLAGMPYAPVAKSLDRAFCWFALITEPQFQERLRNSSCRLHPGQTSGRMPLDLACAYSLVGFRDRWTLARPSVPFYLLFYYVLFVIASQA